MKSTTIVFILFTLACSVARSQTCPSLEKATSDDSVSWLSASTPDEKNAECIYAAIKKLGEAKHQTAIPALVRLIEFRRPKSDAEKLGIYIRLQDTGEKYPAVRALGEIGRSSMPAILAVISSQSTSDLSQRNAVDALMQFYQYHASEGIAVLRRQQDAASDPESKNRLMHAALIAIDKWCTDKVACRQAAQ